jgi:eukaryotic-like serine/threonine-protein kinase
MGYGNIGPPMALHKQPSSCATCGLPLSFAGAPCAECTALTQHAGEAGWRARASSRRSLAPGDLLEGKWRLEDLLGAGGMGQVFRALDVALERTVAIKLLHEALCEDPESVARFEREARAMARLEHPHITPIHAVGQEGGRPFIVMKHLEGMSLARYLRSVPGPLPVLEVLGLARQLCAGLDFIHQRGCVHRDIKPGNVFLSPGGRATLLDFGILWEHRGDEATRSGLRMGTPSYMAPEQARGEPVDGRADVYSLGLVLLEALTGLPPSNTCRLLGEGLPQAAKAIREQAPWLPARMTDALVRASALNPEQRHPGALEMLAALEDAAKVAPESSREPTTAPVLKGRGTRWRSLTLTALGGAGVGALLFGLFMIQRPKDAPPVVTWVNEPIPVAMAPERTAPTESRDPGASTLDAPTPAPRPAEAETRPHASSTSDAPAKRSEPEAPGSSESAPKEPRAAAEARGSSMSAPTGMQATMEARGSSESAPKEPRAAMEARGSNPSSDAAPKGHESSAIAAPEGHSVETSSPRKDSAPKAPARQGKGSAKAGGSKSTTVAPGELRVVTVHDGKMVWANVSVDGKPHGATPLSLDLPSGRHTVRVEREGFTPEQRQVDISPGAKAVVRIELRP